MKKSILLTALCIAFAYTSNAQTKKVTKSAEKVKSEQENVNEANKDLDKAKKELAFEIAEYKKDKEKNLAKNDAKIAECKSQFKSDKNEAKEEYYKKWLSWNAKTMS